MQKMIPWIGSLAGSYVGWFLGDMVGMFTAIMLSIVGAGIGMYLGRRWVLNNL